MIKALLMGIANVTGGFHMVLSGRAPVEELPKPEYKPQESEVMAAQQDFFAARLALRQAEQNFANADSDYINVAINELNVAMHRADVATQKVRTLLGIPLADDEKLGKVAAMKARC